MINLRHFFALDVIARHGRLNAAAETLHVSQSALTQALRRLESSAGAALFERAAFGVQKTPAGALLVRRSQRASGLLQAVERELGLRSVHKPLHRHVTHTQLRALIAVAENGGYRLAARQLGVSQPSVHRAVKSLGEATGLSLFERRANGVAATPMAEVLARTAQLVLGEIRQGLEEIREQQGGTSSRIAVGSLPLVRTDFLPNAITDYLERFPDAAVSVLDGPYVEQLQALRCGKIDWLIGALRDPLPAGDVVQETLFEQTLAVVVRPGHPLIGPSPPSIEALASLDWVLPRSGTPARRSFEGFFEDRARLPTRIIECSSLIVTRSLLLQSDRAAILSPLQIQSDVAAGNLAILIDSVPDSSRRIGLTMRNDWAPTELQSNFTQTLRRSALDV